MIKALITDFDGTLADTFEANLKAYQEAFKKVNLSLTTNSYRECYGLRFDDFMRKVGISDRSVIAEIRNYKKEIYPKYFDCIKLNHNLMKLLSSFHEMGGRTAVASTARKENLIAVIDFLGLTTIFDVICSGADVIHGKPSPEIYLCTMSLLRVEPNEALIFEDSEVGIRSATASGAGCIPVSLGWFDKK